VRADAAPLTANRICDGSKHDSLDHSLATQNGAGLRSRKSGLGSSGVIHFSAPEAPAGAR
jgi:hypothetical protein